MGVRHFLSSLAMTAGLAASLVVWSHVGAAAKPKNGLWSNKSSACAAVKTSVVTNATLHESEGSVAAPDNTNFIWIKGTALRDGEIGCVFGKSNAVTCAAEGENWKMKVRQVNANTIQFIGAQLGGTYHFCRR
jgi:hypothetical protein